MGGRCAAIREGVWFVVECCQAMFAGKLREMEQQYENLQRSIRTFGRQSPPQIRRALCQAKQTYHAYNCALEARAAHSRSRAVRELASLQQENGRALEWLLESGTLAQLLHVDKASRDEDCAEAAALYAEYAMDYAAQTMQYALIAALSAMELQFRLPERQAEAQTGSAPDE